MTDPPEFGTAIVNDVGKELAVDEYGVLWEITVKIPLVFREDKTREAVGTKAQEYKLRHMSADQRVQPRVVDLTGKPLNREQVLQRLKRETPVLVSLRAEHPDSYYLRLAKPDTLVVIFGPFDGGEK